MSAAQATARSAVSERSVAANIFTAAPLISSRRVGGADGHANESACPEDGSASAASRRGARLDDAGLVGEHDGLDAVAQAQLHQHASDVRLHRRLADEELLRDL